MDKSIFDYKDDAVSSIDSLREYLIDEADYEEDEVNDMDAYELVESYLEYNGIVGYTADILSVVCAAFEINEED